MAGESQRGWLEVDTDWAYWINRKSFRMPRIKGRVPVGSLVVQKFREENEVTGAMLVVTEYFVATSEGLEALPGKAEASESLLAQMLDYMRKKKRYPPDTRIAQAFKNGNVKLEYAPGQYDKFSLRLTAEQLGEDPSLFLSCLGPHEDEPEGARGAEPWRVEPAKSGRAACRTCGEKIAKDDLRLGEPTLFEDRVSYKWHHLGCAAKRLHDPDAMDGYSDLDDRAQFEVKYEILGEA